MTKTWKWISIIAFSLLVITSVFQSCKINSLEKKNQIQTVEILTANDSAAMFKTKSGELYFQLNAATVESNSLKRSLEVAGFELSELRQKDINWRNITDILKAELEAAGTIDSIRLTDTVYVHDGISEVAKHFTWTDEYLTLSGYVKTFTINDLKHTYKIKLSSITETKGKESKVTIYSDDPNAKILTGYQVSVVNKTAWYKRWYVWGGVGLVGGYFISK